MDSFLVLLLFGRFGVGGAIVRNLVIFLFAVSNKSIGKKGIGDSRDLELLT
ncbi:MAG: hypothetical protein ACI9XO_001999 [Paraglaciecola sp.]|jgi:hypothetical protein